MGYVDLRLATLFRFHGGIGLSYCGAVDSLLSPKLMPALIGQL
jgi:hypothetical protein